jgi:pimeloyl-ACP methyl ester carboxylesterase
MSGPFGTIRNAHGERIDATYHPGNGGAPAAPAPDALVVLAHGVTSNKDRPWLIALAEGLAAAGLPSLRISFAGNGDSEGRYEEATPLKEAADLGSVLDAVKAAGVARVAYAGHSMGGAVGVLRAEADPRIDVLVSLAGMLHVHDFMQQQFGRLAFGDLMLDKPGCPWSETMADTAARIGSLTEQAARIRVPWLLVHGDADELVPLRDSLDARAAAGGRPELVILPGVDHRFTGAIPAMVEAVVPWLVARLRS